ncbi:bifunctional transaldolase/phosoglucose isomerase [Commensalibacter sp. Nvir]|uniref:bifunctional transaldolase/phosoglucose isomerase n=1 Tax=Commensalibacter sp. Nvir TaxID=3069817 RepID=UPI0030C87EA4
MVENPLIQLEKYGQSPWLDFIQRSFTQKGGLKKLVDEDGLKGVTSNPSIFEKAMGHGTDYDEQFKQLAADDITDVATLYETMAIDDIKAACKVLFPVWEKTKGIDGYVSLEVSPYIAMDGQKTIEEAKRLWNKVAEKNLMIKIPATEPCIPAIQSAIVEGINVNVTLLFALDTYKNVLEAYIVGLENRLAQGQKIDHIASVASFFVSRIDTEIDKKIDERVANGDTERAALKAVRGQVALANAKLAYQHYLKIINSERWKKLAAAGAKPQRLLWASTGCKDKTFPDTLYIDNLIGENTVNTIPPATLDAFRDHGTAARTLDQKVEEAKKTISEAERLRLDLAGTTKKLLEEGVVAFAEAFDQLLGSVAAKQIALQGDELLHMNAALTFEHEEWVNKGLENWRKKGYVRKIWAKDSSVWTGEDESKWLGWLDIVDEQINNLSQLEAFQKEVKAKGFTDILLLGMGGSSLGPEVLGEVFGHQAGYPHLHVLDSTDPQQIYTFQQKVDLKKTLFVVSSKSGSTLEPNILKAYFFNEARKVLGDKVGQHFVAVTDPGSHMEDVAKRDGFWKIFYGKKDIGGRYSVLSNFGIVPAAAAGLPLKEFLYSAQRMEKMCSAGAPPAQNPGVQLGAIWGTSVANLKRDKFTIVASKAIISLGSWLEQLLAESTGKQGTGIIPIDEETLSAPELYGNDRLFIHLKLGNQDDRQQEKALQSLQSAGHPVVTLNLHNKAQLAQVFFQTEFATAVAGAFIGINPFDQPDVEASKIETKKITNAYNEHGSLPVIDSVFEDNNFAVYAGKAEQSSLKSVQSLLDVLKTLFSKIKTGDYVGILAYVERDPETRSWIQELRLAIRDKKKVATAAEFGPRFLHSTGQAYKGGPKTGVFLQITADDAKDLPVPGEKYTFSIVKEAQARGDFDVLSERDRRVIRIHIKGDLKSGLHSFSKIVLSAL